MAIKGQLNEMSLPTLVQMTCQEGTQAQLTVQHGDATATLYFSAGNIIHAALGDQVGEEVIYNVLKWEQGEFVMESGIVPPEQTIVTPWSALLMNGMQQIDEERWDGADELTKEEVDMPENMKDILQELGGQVPGFISAAIVGMDGLGIAQHSNAPVDVESINAQMTLLIKLVDTTVDKIDAGVVEDYLLTTEHAYLMIRFLEGNDYYLGVAADKETVNLGNLRLNSRVYSKRLDKAMPR
jgi:predicted regulator of Ras-like GTPase activity (Roadblock/LC7/MglB family)